MTLSSVGLPLLNGFIGEFLAFYGAFQSRALFGLIATTRVSGVRGICSGSISARFRREQEPQERQACTTCILLEKFAVLPTAVAP